MSAGFGTRRVARGARTCPHHLVARRREGEEPVKHEVLHGKHHKSGHAHHGEGGAHEHSEGLHVAAVPATRHAHPRERKQAQRKISRAEHSSAHLSMAMRRVLPPPRRHLSFMPRSTGWLNVKSGTEPSGGSLYKQSHSREARGEVSREARGEVSARVSEERSSGEGGLASGQGRRAQFYLIDPGLAWSPVVHAAPVQRAGRARDSSRSRTLFFSRDVSRPGGRTRGTRGLVPFAHQLGSWGGARL